MTNNRWHLAFIPVDLSNLSLGIAYKRMVEWCMANAGVKDKDWACTGDMQIDNYWVFGFKEQETSVHFTMVFA